MLRVALFALLWLAAPASAEMRLVMIEEHGCVWCARWNAEIGPIYPKTDVGSAAPLQRLDIDAAGGSGIAFDRSLHFTPTFVIVKDGQEVGRLEGYPGEDFFWPIVEKMVADAAEKDLG